MFTFIVVLCVYTVCVPFGQVHAYSCHSSVMDVNTSFIVIFVKSVLIVVVVVLLINLLLLVARLYVSYDNDCAYS